MRRTPTPGAGVKKRKISDQQRRTWVPPSRSIGIKMADRTAPARGDQAHNRLATEVDEERGVVSWVGQHGRGVCTFARWNEFKETGDELEVRTSADERDWWRG